MSTAVGVDGCKAGWFYFRIDQKSVSFGVASDIHKLTSALPVGSRIFIDIPIGLIYSNSEGRACDGDARKALGSPRASSVFSAPVFSVLEAANYEEAQKLSLRAIGKKLSRQAFAINPKIREVNDYLISNRDSEYLVREIHPEVCFWSLNDLKPMKYSKKRITGFEERLRVLEKHLPNAHDHVDRALNKYLRREVARDDILDALVGMVVASTPEDKLKTMPPAPPKDSRGLPMKIVYT